MSCYRTTGRRLARCDRRTVTYLARNLLCDDGVIFISIDDNEVENVRRMCNEIFGEENFITTVIWQKVYAPKSSARHFSEDHDYILVYARNSLSWVPGLLPRTEEQDSHYGNPDNDPRGPWRADGMSARNYYSKGTYKVTTPSGRIIDGPPSGRYWVYSEEKFKQLDSDNRIWWGKDGDNNPAVKRFLSEVKQGRVPQTLWTYSEVGHTQEAKKELIKAVDFPNSDSVFDTPKPTRLLKRMLQIATKSDEDSIVLDFFAGSATMADSVYQQNNEDGGNRKYIVVQLPEPIDGTEQGAQLQTISDIGKQRIRYAVSKIREERAGKMDLEGKFNSDLGFKLFKLDRSNFKQWQIQSDELTSDGLAKQLELQSDNIDSYATDEEILYELLIKSGFTLTERVESLYLAGKSVFSIADGALLVCLDEEITAELIDAVADKEPMQFICLDKGFKGNDQLKANAVQTFKSRSQNAETEMVFKVV
jgi:adenine-specific DNA-methyltransferase